MQQGITFDAGGPDVDGPVRDRPFPLDLVPRVIPAAEWTQIKRGLAQRIRALDRFVDDVYHGREIVHDGVVPWELIVSRPAFAREAHGIRPPGGVYCHVSGCDLVRDADGTWKVLEDNVRTPSGISYVLENRVAMLRLLPRLFDAYRVRPVDHYPALLANALRQVAPTEGEEEATVVVWTPGPFNSAYFEHTFLARQMGVELVEASDLVVRDAACYIRTTNGLQRVHAIYRRIDDDFMDPLEFRPDSLLGVPGLMRAYRAGTVAIVNAVGTGVADDKAIYHYVPDMIRYYLSEEPILANVTTYLMADADQRKHVLDRLDEMVVKPTSESGGKGVFIGPAAGEEELARQADVVRREPERWIAQELVQLSTCPTASPDGSLAPRHVDLRPFAVFGEDIHIVPGGLTRVALREGSMIVNSSQGGGSKDTWVLEDDGDGAPDARGAPTALGAPADARPAHGRLDRPAAATAAAGGRCSPGSRTSSTGSAAACRAPSTRRGCSTASSTPTSRAAPPTPARRGCRGRRCWRSWAPTASARSGRDDVDLAAHAGPGRPGVGAVLRQRRARGRAAGARRLLGRDVGGDQHLPPRPAAARHVRGAAQRAVLALRLRARALRAVLGRHRPHDAARRGARVPGGGRRDRGRRHGAADAARRAADRRGRADRGRPARRAGGGAAAGDGRLPGVPARDPGAAEGEPRRLVPALRARLPGLGGALRLRPPRRADRGRLELPLAPRRCCG